MNFVRSLEWLEARVEVVSETGCWIWVRALDPEGYAKSGGSNGTIAVHRAAYEFAYGAIPVGMYVCHKCDVRCCVNPKHLYAGTASQNQFDRAKSLVTKRSQPWGRRHDGLRKELMSSDERTSVIAARHGVAARYVRQLRAEPRSATK